jgi:hypothetical protein
LESGETLDLRQLSDSFGTAVERLLCDLFQMHSAASRYWVDGLIVDVATIKTGRVLAITGRAWCANHNTQWQVPAEILFAFSDAEPAGLLSMTIRVGNAGFRTLGEHRGRNITRREPECWLFEFEFIGTTVDGQADVSVHHAGAVDEIDHGRQQP